MTKYYHEVIQLPTFEERFEYLRIKQRIGDSTFGSHRYLNQLLYKMPEWRTFRSQIILRDNACDLAHSDYQVNAQPLYVHHINPITIEDIQHNHDKVFDPDNAITTTFMTHQAIHYGDKSLLTMIPVERRPGDMCPWKG